MSPRILRASLALVLLLVASTWAQAQNQVYRCGDTHEYTDKPCTDAALVDLKRADNIMQPGPTSVPPPPPPERGAPAVIWPNSSRVVSTPPAPASNIWSERDSRQATPAATPANSVGRPGRQ